MSRLAVVAVCLAVPLLGGAASVPSAGPPSSLEPGPHGTVTMSHNHWKVTACSPRHSAGKLTCHAQKAEADAALVLQLRPVRTPELVGKDPRKPVSVAIPSGTGPESAKVRLRAGTWEIDWPRHKPHERFLVGDGDEFGIQLVTRTGRCRAVKHICRLEPGKTERSVRIPAAHRAASDSG